MAPAELPETTKRPAADVEKHEMRPAGCSVGSADRLDSLGYSDDWYLTARWRYNRSALFMERALVALHYAKHDSAM